MTTLVEPQRTITVNNTDVQCEIIEGKVVGLRKDTRTYVESSGPDINPRGAAYQINQRISTRIETHTNFLLLKNDGSERPYTFFNDLMLRDGHVLTNVHLHCGNCKPMWALMVNHTTRECKFIQRKLALPFLIGAIRRIRFWWMAAIFLPFLLIGLNMAKGGETVIGLGILVSVATVVVGFVIQVIRSMLFWRKLKPHLDRIAQNLLTAV